MNAGLSKSCDLMCGFIFVTSKLVPGTSFEVTFFIAADFC